MILVLLSDQNWSVMCLIKVCIEDWCRLLWWNSYLVLIPNRNWSFTCLIKVSVKDWCGLLDWNFDFDWRTALKACEKLCRFCGGCLWVCRMCIFRCGMSFEEGEGVWMEWVWVKVVWWFKALFEFFLMGVLYFISFVLWADGFQLLELHFVQGCDFYLPQKKYQVGLNMMVVVVHSQYWGVFLLKAM